MEHVSTTVYEPLEMGYWPSRAARGENQIERSALTLAARDVLLQSPVLSSSDSSDARTEPRDVESRRRP